MHTLIPLQKLPDEDLRGYKQGNHGAVSQCSVAILHREQRYGVRAGEMRLRNREASRV
jgi:hypothetical protein